MPHRMTELRNCQQPLHPKVIEGLELFNRRSYFEAHESLEAAWKEEATSIRDLYRGILQAAVVYLHITHCNFPGAVKVYQRSQKWLTRWPETCRGIQVGQLQRDLQAAMLQVERLGPERLSAFDPTLLKPVLYEKN